MTKIDTKLLLRYAEDSPDFRAILDETAAKIQEALLEFQSVSRWKRCHAGRFVWWWKKCPT